MKYSQQLLNILKSYSSIIFIDNPIVATIIFSICFIKPNIALSGIITVICIHIFAKLLAVQNYLEDKAYIYNTILVGMAIGFIYPISIISTLLLISSAVATFVLIFSLSRVFTTSKLPVLSLPFSIIAIIIYFASLKYYNHTSFMLSSTHSLELPLIISGLLKSLSGLFFLSSNIVGLIILLLIFITSRVIFIITLIGYYFGILCHGLFIGSFEHALYNAYAFNYILVAIALCGVFLLPSITSFIISLIAIMITVIVSDSLSVILGYYNIPIFTLPFNIVTISFIFMLGSTRYKHTNHNIKSTPEKSLLDYLNTSYRFGNTAKISLPFTGKWSVYQAFNDKWTHKGKYQHAYDFVKKIDNKSYRNSGAILGDYYSFGEVITTPVNGYVIACRHDLTDNPIGKVDKANNWGNYIIIKSDLGFFVKICHLMQFSLTVKSGDYIATGNIIAKCGNSGYSPEPHIHIQVQNIGYLGSPTIEFCFDRTLYTKQLKFNYQPQKNDHIHATNIDKGIYNKLNFILDDSFTYNVYENNIFKEQVAFTVFMNENGEFYFQDNFHNKLFFHNNSTEFYFYKYSGKKSYLKSLFLLAPRFPFINTNNIEFDDFIPLELTTSILKQNLFAIIAIFNKKLSHTKVTYKYNNGEITSKYGRIALSLEYKGFNIIEFNKTKLERSFD